MDKPLVTIAIATHNGEETIGRLLEGVLSIPYPNLEVLIGDDGSTDGTRAICHNFEDRISNFHFFDSSERMGINANYNRLLSRASGKYYVIFDQDDEREPSFIPKCVDQLEANAEAVLCHSHTGVKWRDRLYHVNNLNSLVRTRTVYGRLWKFLRRPSDINIYGLIRREALVRAGGWQAGPSNTNRLLIGLLLQGKFLQIEETLFWYRAKGLRYRPSVEQELMRSQPNASKKHHRLPFVGLLRDQLHDIGTLAECARAKLLLAMILMTNFALVNGARMSYRLVWMALGERTPSLITRMCSYVVYPDDDIQYIIAREEDSDYYPREWPLRRIPQSPESE